jgi:hypothetical protein
MIFSFEIGGTLRHRVSSEVEVGTLVDRPY